IIFCAEPDKTFRLIDLVNKHGNHMKNLRDYSLMLSNGSFLMFIHDGLEYIKYNDVREKICHP
ncbi:MAG: hypothetical protein ACRD5J_10415, partial [Nitrososphaeraceae archaeon]